MPPSKEGIVVGGWAYASSRVRRNLYCRATLDLGGPKPRPHAQLSSLQIFQHLLCVALGFHVLEDMRDAAIRPNYERRSRDPLHFFSVHVLLLDHAEGLADFLISVGQQGVREIVLILKLFLTLRRIG
jgi:hypothetical protein